jgi:hypothetical protein
VVTHFKAVFFHAEVLFGLSLLDYVLVLLVVLLLLLQKDCDVNVLKSFVFDVHLAQFYAFVWSEANLFLGDDSR